MDIVKNSIGILPLAALVDLNHEDIGTVFAARYPKIVYFSACTACTARAAKALRIQSRVLRC